MDIYGYIMDMNELHKKPITITNQILKLIAEIPLSQATFS